MARTTGEEDFPRRAWLGVPVLVGLSLTITAVLGLRVGGAGRSYQQVMFLLLIVGLLLTLGCVGLAMIDASKSKVGALRLVAWVWTRPPADWVMFIFGVILALPLLAFFTRVISGDSDSTRLVASIRYVETQDWRYLIHTQENYLPHLVMGPVLAIGGIPGLKVLTILTLICLVGLVSYLTWKLTHRALAGLAAALALLCFPGILSRTAYLPMYPAMLGLGYAGVYLTYRATQTTGRQRLTMAALAGLCLALCPEAQPVGQLFLVTPILVAIAVGFRRAIPGLVRVLVALAIFSLPRGIINLSEGGLSHFLSYRIDFWTTHPYLTDIQTNFYHYPARLSYPNYLVQLGIHMPADITGRLGLTVVALGTVGLLVCSRRVRWFGVLAGVFFVAPLLIERGPFFSRYFSPLLVGAALGVGLLIDLLDRWRLGRRLVAPGIVAVLFASAIATLGFGLANVRADEAAVLNGPYREIAAHITDGKGVIGSRSLDLLFVDPNIRAFGSQFLDEKDYLTFLTWPSDQQVIRMLNAHDIGWVLVTSRRWEVKYNNAWVRPNFGQAVQQLHAIKTSPNFCLVSQVGSYRLYKVGCSPVNGAGG